MEAGEDGDDTDAAADAAADVGADAAAENQQDDGVGQVPKRRKR